MNKKIRLHTIDIKDFKLVHWLAIKTVVHLTTSKDKQLARHSLLRFNKMINVIDSWDKGKK